MACPAFRPISRKVPFNSCAICLGTEREVDGFNRETRIVGHIAGGSGDSTLYHLFHETCIRGAIASQSKCPHCRLDHVRIIETLSDSVFDAIMSNNVMVKEIHKENMAEALWLSVQMNKDKALKTLIQLHCFKKHQGDILSQPLIEEMLSNNLPFLKAILTSRVVLSDNQFKSIISKASEQDRKKIVATLIVSSSGKEEVLAELFIELTQKLKDEAERSAAALTLFRSREVIVTCLKEIVSRQKQVIEYSKNQIELIFVQGGELLKSFMLVTSALVAAGIGFLVFKAKRSPVRVF